LTGGCEGFCLLDFVCGLVVGLRLFLVEDVIPKIICCELLAFMKSGNIEKLEGVDLFQGSVG